jgi:hypothetical protein
MSSAPGVANEAVELADSVFVANTHDGSPFLKSFLSDKYVSFEHFVPQFISSLVLIFRLDLASWSVCSIAFCATWTYYAQ